MRRPTHPLSVASVFLACVSLAFSMTGCSSTPRFGPPIATVEPSEVEASGGIRTRGLVEPEEGELEPATTPAEFEGRVFLARVDHALASEIFGTPFMGVEGNVVTEAEAQRVQDSICRVLCRLVAQESTLTLANGQPGWVSVENEISYIRGFELEATRGAMILDPIVDVVREGVRIHLQSDYDSSDGPWKVGMRIHMAAVTRPIPMVVMPAFPGGTMVTMQTPVFSHLELKSQAELEAGQALVLTGVGAANGDEVLIAILRPRRVEVGAQPSE